jgi:DNA-directed RNA polymerase sigma subunit (sigma70/sigma32)
MGELKTMKARDAALVLSGMRELSAVKRQVLEMRFGLGGRKPTTLRDVAKIVDTNPDRVRRLEAAALTQLAEYATERTGDG